jgi:hypothetical protein
MVALKINGFSHQKPIRKSRRETNHFKNHSASFRWLSRIEKEKEGIEKRSFIQKVKKKNYQKAP